mmetsp:Transcript_20086/g.30857  ORF Transcript_20086/g.30857 Transcript_20086/m.30857 type:complete len:150 (+) Transcript_20086:1127-1576(+)
MDDGESIIGGVQTNHLLIYSGKVGGGNEMLSPLSIVNDGMFEISYAERLSDRFTYARAYRGVKMGGIQNYVDGQRVHRVKSLKVVNRSTEKQWIGGEYLDVPRYQPLDIDGEVFDFKKSVKYECLQEALPTIVDFKSLVETQYLNKHAI